MKDGKLNYTSVAELAAELDKIIKAGHGDYPVCINGIAYAFIGSRPYYYDGGYWAIEDDAHNTNEKGRSFLRSRTNLANDIGFKSNCYDIRTIEPEPEDTLDGRLIQQIDTECWNYLDEREQEERKIFDGQLVKYEHLKERSKELDCYPVKAYLASGEQAIGSSIEIAKKALIEVYQKLHKID